MTLTKGKILLVFLGAIMATLLLEGACKYLDIKSQRSRASLATKISRISDIEDIRYELIPGVTGVTPGQKVEIRVNNLGFRGPDVSEEKPDGVTRICIIGDSITLARYLPEEQTFAHLLETHLNDTAENNEKFEVINCGFSGRDTWEETALLKERVLRLQPDLVILQICLNDHVRLPKMEIHSSYGAFGERAWYSYSSLLRLLDRKVDGFRALHVATLKTFHLDHRDAVQVMNDQCIGYGRIYQLDQHWDNWRGILADFHQICQNKHVTDLFAVFPLREQIAQGEAASAPLLTAWANEERIPFIDLIDIFKKRQGVVLRDYTHPNAYGNQLTAAALGKKVDVLLHQ